MIISIDLGNKQVKSIHSIFTSAIQEGDTKLPFGDDILRYSGRYYALSERRIPYTRRKYEDERFFVLALFAIAKELEAANVQSFGTPISLTVLTGLPPSHYGAQYRQFETFFRNRGVIRFEYNNKTYCVQIDGAMCYPQAIAAAMTVFGQIRQYPRCLVIDLGGYTADYVQIQNGRADFAVCDSLEYGIIKLYNDVLQKVNADLDMLLTESDIDMVIQGKDTSLPAQVKAIIHAKTIAFVNELVGMLRERGIDMRVTKAVFTGGGAILLRPYIENCDKIDSPVFIEDIRANVRGYELMYRLR